MPEPLLRFGEVQVYVKITMDWISTVSKIATGLLSLLLLIVGAIGVFNGWFRFLKNFNKAAKTINSFSEKILPKAIQGLEDKGVLPKGTLAQWTEVLSSGLAPAHSPRELNESGEGLLEDSGMKRIIDDNSEKFLTSLERMHLRTPLDVEQQSFYVLKGIEVTDIVNPIKSYIYSHPGQEINKIFFVGAIYLRNKYKERHPELFTT